MHVSFEEAQEIIDSAVKKSKELNLKMCIAVLDSGGNIKAFARMDDAWVGSSDIAIKKAKTACYFAMPSGEIGKLSVPGKPLYGIEHSNDGLISFPGGVPIVDKDGILIGAVGVSGDTVENDNLIAVAGATRCGACEMADHPWRT
ncbi:MAG: GlcG/HbpS family heme-binding protein [Methylophilaceae bacterium]